MGLQNSQARERKSTANQLAGALMEKRQLEPSKWRANHYVTLLGRALVFKVEDRKATHKCLEILGRLPLARPGNILVS